MDALPDAANAFEFVIEPNEIDGEDDIFTFSDKLYEFSTETVDKEPYSIGAYQFFDMDEENHQYYFIVWANLTSAHA